MYLLAPLASLLLAASSLAAPTDPNSPCTSGCSKWSVVVETCYSQFSISPHTKGAVYSNEFLACLCRGANPNGEFSNATMVQAASICESCSTTPNMIKNDLSTYLTLCAIQSSNGSAANASFYAPIQYQTDPNKVGSTDKKNGAPALRVSGAGLAAAGLAVLASVLVL